MNYNKLTKAQLIERIHELETQTIEYKLESFALESQLLVEDLLKVGRYIFELGARAKRTYETSQLPEYLDELRARTQDLYSQGTTSISKGTQSPMVLLPGETGISVSSLCTGRLNETSLMPIKSNAKVQNTTA